MHDEQNVVLQFLEWVAGAIGLLFAGTWGYILRWRNELNQLKLRMAETYMTGDEVRAEIKTYTESLQRDIGAVDRKVESIDGKVTLLVGHMLEKKGRVGG